jgi:hypothetical protein
MSADILLEMIKDESVSAYKTAAAIRVFTKKYSTQIFAGQKKVAEKILLRRLDRADSPFTQVEIMHALVSLNRYQYFKTMVPALIQKLDHYNDTVKEISYNNLMDIISTGSNRSREASIVFNTMRRILFLSRNRLLKVQEPDEDLKRKLQLLRWSIKILGTEELQRLPKEVIQLL